MEQDKLEKTLRSLEERLSQIETLLNMPPAPQPAIEIAVATPAAPAAPAPLKPPSRSNAPSTGHLISGNWLEIIAVVCFVVAAAFIVKLSIDSGWLTPLRQAGMAGVLGFGLIGIGLALMERDRAYAALLPGRA